MSFESNEAAPSGETFETFDNFEEIAEEAEASDDDDWSKEEAPAKEKVSEDLKVIKDSQVDGEGKLIKDDKQAKKDEDEESEEEDTEEEEEIEDEDSEEEIQPKKDEEKKDSKKLRMRMGDELFNVDSDASFKVKVDGKNEDVPLQELINNYSGKTAWDKKFTEIGKEKKAVEIEKAQITKQSEELKSHVAKALAPLKTKDGNPMDSLLYLVEMSGDDPYNAYRRIMESNLEELGKLMDMGDVERELYFHKKKDELYSDVAKKRQGKLQEEQTFNQAVQKVDALRQSFNVTEDAYVDASDELEEIYTASKLDINDITHEAIVDYASLKPHIAVVKGLIEQYEDNISEGKYGDVVAELSRYLRDGKADASTIKQILARNFSVEEDVKELNSKVYSKGMKAPIKKALKEDSNRFESFDDWE
jgi:hypothetical protein